MTELLQFDPIESNRTFIKFYSFIIRLLCVRRLLRDVGSHGQGGSLFIFIRPAPCPGPDAKNHVSHTRACELVPFYSELL